MHLNELSPKVAPFTTHLVVPSKPLSWPPIPAGCPRRASVNSFGFGGTNAHAILESYDDPVYNSSMTSNGQANPACDLIPFVFSANTEKCLVEKVKSYLDFLETNPNIDCLDLAWNLSRREVFPFKKSFSGSSVASLKSVMKASLQEQKETPEASFGTHTVRTGALETPIKILAVFTGQGAQWARMGVELLKSSQVFSDSIRNLEKALAELHDAPPWSLRQELERPEELSRLGEAVISQPLCTAIQVALVDVLRTAGVRFRTVIGHSSGEIAGAYAAGIISSTDAIRIAYYRGLHTALAAGQTDQKGCMMAAGISFLEGNEIRSRPQFEGRVAVAASNAPTSVTLSGDEDAIHEIKDLLDVDRKFARLLKVDKAYHSHHMKPCVEPYLLSLQGCGLRPQEPTRAVWVSSVYPDRDMVGSNLKSLADTYWTENLSSTVLLSQAIQRAVALSGPFDLALEIGPHSALKGPVTQTIRDLTGSAVPYQSFLRRGQNDTDAFSECLGWVWEQLGASAFDLDKFVRFSVEISATEKPAGRPRLLKNLPTYNWDHGHSYWKESRISKNLRERDAPIHELLGVRSFHDADPYELRWRNILKLEEIPWLRGHRFQNQVLFPGAGYAVLALEASKALSNGRSVKLVEIEELEIFKAITLEEDGPGTEIIFSLNLIDRPNHEAGSVAEFSCYSCHDERKGIIDKCAGGRLYVTYGTPSEDTLPGRVLNHVEPSKIPVTTEKFYNSLLDIGLEYTDLFRTIEDIARRGQKATASTRKVSSTGLMVHPALLDVCFQSIIAALGFPGDGTLWTTYLPVRISRLRVNPVLCERPTSMVEISAQIIEGSSKTLAGDMDAFGQDGKLEIQLEGLYCASFSNPTADNDRLLFSETCWDIDISTGLAADLEIVQTDSVEDLELVDACERASYYYLRTLRQKFSPDETATFEWWYQRIFEFADFYLPLAAEGRVPILRKEWANDTEEEIDAIAERYPGQIEMRLIRAVGKALPSFVTGTEPLLSVMLEDDMLGALYKEGLGAPRVNAIVSRVIKQIVHRYPNMRILEIGGGTGGTTKGVLEALDGKCSYTFTDISTGFFESTKKSLGNLADRVVFRPLDIEKDPASQDFVEGSYDMIIAANVLHATRKLSETIANVRSLLRPGGFLILNEVTGDLLRMRLIMSGLPGWWAGGSDGRRYTPTISMDRWDSMLREGGFSGVDSFKDDLNEPTKRTFSVMVSQAVDEVVEFIRKPLENSFMAPEVEDLIVVGGNSFETAKLLENVRQHLDTWNTEAIYLKTLDSLDLGSVTDGFTLLCMTELDQPVLKDLSSHQLKHLAQIFNHAKNILWVNSTTMKDGPYAMATVGLARTMLMECPQLNLQVLDILDYQKADSIAIVDALLRLVTAESLDPRYLWTNEPEISLGGKALQLPRLIANGPLNNRLNSTRRNISESTSVNDQLIELLFTPEGQPLLHRANADFQASDSRLGFSEIKVRFSLPLSMTVFAGWHLFICLGTVSGTGELVVAFSESNKSTVRVRKEWTYICSSEILGYEKEFLRCAAEHVIAQAVLSGVATGDGILFYKPEAQLASVITQRGSELGVRVFCATDEVDKAHCVTGPNIFIHEFDSVRKLKARLPEGIRKFVDCSSCATNGIPERGVVNQIASALPESCVRQTMAMNFGYRSRAELSSISGDLQKFLHSACWQSYAGLKLCEPPHMISLNNEDISDIVRAKGHTYVLDWMAEEQIQVRVTPLDTEALFSPVKTYILFGLSGELGRSLAEWMIANGVKHLVLTSRTPAVEKEWIEEQSRGGATIKVIANDITNRQAVQDLRDEILETMPPVGGVANGAMVLCDSLFQNMDISIWEKTIKPKIDGSRYLDELFPAHDLEFFVMFSSAASVVGNAGQSNYSAGCMFMAGLAEDRRKRGLAASVIQIGMIVGIGYVARTELADKSLLANAFNAISEPLYHQMFAAAIIHGRPDSGCQTLITTGLQRSELAALWADNPRFSHMVLENIESSNISHEVVASVPVKDQLESTTSLEDAVSVLIECFRIKLALVLQAAVENIHPNVQIVNLGIDSLIAVDIRTWFLKELNVDVPVLKVLGGDSISELCREVVGKLTWTMPWSSNTEDSTDVDNSASELDGQETSNITSPPDTMDIQNQDELIKASLCRLGDMSHAQARIFLATNMLEDSSTYNVALAWKLYGNFDIARFERALRAVAQRHESLRTQYYADEITGQPTQRVMESSKLHLEQKRIFDEDSIPGEFERLRRHEFNIEEGDTIRAEILSTPQSCVFLLCYHHIIMDQVSLNIMLSDLAKAYPADSAIMNDAKQYLDFTLAQKRSIENGDLQGDIDFWKAQYPDEPSPLPLFPFSLVKAREELTRYDTFAVGAWLDEELRTRIKQVSGKLNSTPFHFYSATLQVLLFQTLGGTAKDLSIGIADANRLNNNYVDTVGFFVNMLPLRASLQPTDTFTNTVVKARTGIYAGLAHSSIPFDVLVDSLAFPRSTTESPLFQVLFSYTPGVRKESMLGDVKMDMFQIADARSAWDLQVSVTEAVAFSAQNYMYREEDISQLMTRYVELLDTFSKNPSALIG